MASSKKSVGKPKSLAAHGNGGELHQTASAPEDRTTTNHGVPLSDNQNSLKGGQRGPTLLEDFILREKIQHFDHERIPERIVHARGSGAHGFFELTESLAEFTARQGADRGRRKDRGVYAVFDRGRRRRLGGHAARCARLRRQVLYQGGQLGPRRQQHPGVLHPGRDQIPRPHPRREDGGRPRLPAIGKRARHVLGFHRPDAGNAPT